MSYIELFILAVGLSMDAFAVSVCKGLSVQTLRPRHGLICGAYFGAFQALMPVIGWLLGRQFESLIKSIDHWIAFVLLGLIGANMIREALKKEEETVSASFSPRAMLPLAVATSIDALAVGVTFAFLDVAIVPAVSLIGATTFEEYKNHFEKSKSLVRRFQNVEIREPSQEETVEILKDVINTVKEA